jgi:hypothetical protein
VDERFYRVSEDAGRLGDEAENIKRCREGQGPGLGRDVGQKVETNRLILFFRARNRHIVVSQNG